MLGPTRSSPGCRGTKLRRSPVTASPNRTSPELWAVSCEPPEPYSANHLIRHPPFAPRPFSSSVPRLIGSLNPSPAALCLASSSDVRPCSRCSQWFNLGFGGQAGTPEPQAHSFGGLGVLGGSPVLAPRSSLLALLVVVQTRIQGSPSARPHAVSDALRGA